MTFAWNPGWQLPQVYARSESSYTKLRVTSEGLSGDKRNNDSSLRVLQMAMKRINHNCETLQTQLHFGNIDRVIGLWYNTRAYMLLLDTKCWAFRTKQDSWRSKKIWFTIERRNLILLLLKQWGRNLKMMTVYKGMVCGRLEMCTNWGKNKIGTGENTWVGMAPWKCNMKNETWRDSLSGRPDSRPKWELL